MALPEIELPNYLAEPEQHQEPSVLSVLDRFAEQLPGQTGAFVQGMVNVAPFLGTTRYTFYLVIPTVNDYTDPLFYVWNLIANTEYPIKVLPAGANQEDAEELSDAAALTMHLNNLFKDEWVKSKIRQWIELARDRTPRQQR